METDPNFIQTILGNAYFNIFTACVFLASAIAAVTPSKADNQWIQKILDLLNLVGININKATNKDG